MRLNFDLHMHTDYSPCSRMDPEDLVERAVKKGLDVICITDHNHIGGAVDAWNYQQKHKLPITIEIGYEATTNMGEVLLNFLSSEEAEMLMNRETLRYSDGCCNFNVLYEIVDYNKSNGSGMLVGGNHIPNFAWGGKRKGLNLLELCGVEISFDKVRKALIVDKTHDRGDHKFNSLYGFGSFVDYIEENGANMSVEESIAAIQLAKFLEKTAVYNSDGHFLRQIGKFCSVATGKDVRTSILEGKVEIPDPRDLNYLINRYYRTREGLTKKSKKRAALNKS